MKHAYALLFLVFVAIWGYFVADWVNWWYFIVFAAVLGWYMAMNIGANDVANSVWPAVWSKALTLWWAIVLAAIFEASWALIAGWEVVDTIKKWIINIDWFQDPNMFMFAMMAALVAAAIWLNLATYLKAPVSTTHSIVWWVMWAWIAALWFSVVDWWTMGKIAASWVISPVLGGIIAAGFLLMIKETVMFKADKVKAAKSWVPFFVSIMAWAFTAYLTLKWLKKIWPNINEFVWFIDLGEKPDFITAAILWLIVASVVFFFMKKRIDKKAHHIENNRDSINKLFNIPLIFAVALLSFAHGSNDVANAIWPLAAIYDTVINSSVSTSVGIPIWIMVIWWLWISVWLALYWPRIIKTVWHEITELDQVRAFSIALSAAITVIIASQLQLPVSSTHIALGWVFGVGFLREYLDRKHHNKKEIYVRRDMIWKIASAWIITVPAVAMLSWLIFILLAATL